MDEEELLEQQKQLAGSTNNLCISLHLKGILSPRNQKVYGTTTFMVFSVTYYSELRIATTFLF